uniref:Uncharacterized protein n=1 Tax=Quercus lobata TaxID=97700 RepID=A0A7N2R8T8_QUELO
MENYNVFVPNNSFVECFKMDTVKETKLLGTLSEKRLAIDVKPLPVSVSQKMSHSTADDGAPKKDLLMTPEAKDIHSEGSMGEAEIILIDATVREVDHPTNIVVHVKENDGKSSSYCKTEMPGLELEARISRLERAVAELKAARANN